VAQSECILIIDDEEVLRDGCTQALTEKGYVTVPQRAAIWVCS
jgi:DNA-binding NtrC family response regulator